MRIENAPPATADVVRQIIAGQMTTCLMRPDAPADLSDRAACIASLEANGFGALSIATLADRAIADAKAAGDGD